MNNTLIIDCSSGMNIFLLTETEKYEKIDRNQKKHTDELLLSVSEMLESAGLTPRDIRNICVFVGPGSFTGIRVAVAIAKGLSIGSGANVFVSSNFDAYDRGLSDAVYVLDGFSDFVYSRIIVSGAKTDSCEHIGDLAQKLAADYKDVPVFVQSEALLEKFKLFGISSQITQYFAAETFEKIISTSAPTPLNEICPIYLRASQAEIERNERLRGTK